MLHRPIALRLHKYSLYSFIIFLGRKFDGSKIADCVGVKYRSQHFRIAAVNRMRIPMYELSYGLLVQKLLKLFF